MKTKFFIILFVSVLLIAGGCKKEPEYRIGVSQCAGSDWRVKLNDEILRESLFYDNVEIEIRNADDNNERQKEDLRYFASNGFDIIITSPTEADALTPLIDSIYQTGLPIIVFDRNLNNEQYTTFIGADNEEIGRSAAKYIRSLTPDPQVIELMGTMTTTPAQQRHRGFIKEAESSGKINVLASEWGEWGYHGGKRVTDSLLRIYPQTNVIYAHNDPMAYGASDAAKDLGLRDQITIIGIDGSPDPGLHAVMDTIIDATFVYPTGGREIFKTAMAILKNEKVPKKIVLRPGALVDLSNAEILLRQNDELNIEANEIKDLKDKLDFYWEQHSMQSIILYAVIVIAILLGGLVFLLLRSWHQQKKHHAVLKQKKEEIENILERLQQATKSKLTFFTNVSHDLRTPLTLIAEPVEQLKEASNLEESQHRLMALASKNVKILMRLINQILDFRKYENDKLDLNLSETNLADKMRLWADSFKELASRRNINFQLIIADDEDYNIAVDVEKIERVVFNLLSNAFKFTPENGSITLALWREPEFLCFKVTDNGKGIGQEDLEQIFHCFYKVDKINPHGSGIGLAVSKAFVEIHGGNIEAESAIGQGTSFSIKIPVKHVESKANIGYSTLSANEVESELEDIDSVASAPSETAPTILVIDDNKDIGTLIETLLGERFTILKASNGTEGIEIATKYIPDLVICDVMMPGIDGIETCRRLKNDVKTSHIPVLMLTACAMDEQRIEGYESGADAYISKPFNTQVLKSRIDSLLENRKRLKSLYSNLKGADSEAKETSIKGKGKKTSDIDDEFYRKFVELVKKRMADPDINVDDLAEALNMSRIQLYRKIKALTNHAPSELLRNLRLEHAAFLLKTKNMTISEVGIAVGFVSHSHFTKCYREYFGVTPSKTQRNQ